jgi:hypothetical protein
MINFDHEEFEELKMRVNSDYKKIGNIYCPALKSKIVFNANGIHHLRYDYNRIERSKPVQYNKLRFFRASVEILKLSTTIQEYRRNIFDENNSDKRLIVEWFAFWSIISFKKCTRIKVIIKRIGGESGQYQFWSVMPFWTLSHDKRIIGLIELEDE